MGFDVLYFPPIHPIGGAHRKGKNNSGEADPGEPGSPWAIGSQQGGHKAVHPELGTLDEFRHLVSAALQQMRRGQEQRHCGCGESRPGLDSVRICRITWQGPRNYVELRPNEVSAHILRKE